MIDFLKLSSKKKVRNTLFIFFILLFLLLSRLAYIQLIKGEELQALAYKQQTLNRNINPKRGIIYDSTGKYILAISSTVYTVTVNPNNISKDQKEDVSRVLSDIFELDYENVLKKVKKKSSIETIAKKVDKEKTDELRKWIEQNEITTGINIDEDTKRYYPYANLASHVIGFCGGDNQGLEGLEAKYDEELSGMPGRIERLSNATGEEIGTEGEKYIDAIDGNNLVLSIDMTIQAIAEKYLEQACIDNICTDGGNVIVMNPNTGDVLAMVTYPGYDLNDSYTINNEEIRNIWDTLEQSEKTKKLQAMWRNKAIADTYEPGSVFKLITASSALEEKITDTDNSGEFNCSGGIEIAGVRIKCWRYYRPHGSQSLRDALMNSCNPIFIGLGQKIGVEKYYNYLKKFEILEKTGITLPGEAKGIFLDKSKVGPVELATISFGQRFEITPIQMITAVSTIANGGEKIEPRIVKKIVNSQTGEEKEIEVKKKERVISKETSQKVLSMMESVVSEGTGKNAKVAGYRIGGKTGTSEDGVNTNKYVSSFVGVAPINEPKVVILITLYNPTGDGGHQGGGVAAPLGGQILSEILPYLEIPQGNVDEVKQRWEITVPKVTEKTLDEATKILKEQGLETIIENEEEDMSAAIVTNQLPQPGIKVYNGSAIYITIK